MLDHVNTKMLPELIHRRREEAILVHTVMKDRLRRANQSHGSIYHDAANAYASIEHDYVDEVVEPILNELSMLFHTNERAIRRTAEGAEW